MKVKGNKLEKITSANMRDRWLTALIRYNIQVNQKSTQTPMLGMQNGQRI